MSTTLKPKRKIKHHQRAVSQLWKRINRNTLHPVEKGGAAYIPLQAVKDLLAAYGSLRRAQREYEDQRPLSLEHDSERILGRLAMQGLHRQPQLIVTEFIMDAIHAVGEPEKKT